MNTTGKSALSVLKGLVLSGLLALTALTVHPYALFGHEDGCALSCVVKYGPCKPGTDEWEGFWCKFTGCEGSLCEYTCGFESEEECLASFGN